MAARASSTVMPRRSGIAVLGISPVETPIVTDVPCTTSAPAPIDWLRTVPLGSSETTSELLPMSLASRNTVSAASWSSPTTEGTTVVGTLK